MNCLMCGAEMEEQRDTVPFKALPGVELENVLVRRCPECGEEEVEIPNLEELHEALADMVVTTKTRFNGDHVRFLRKYLGLSGRDFAHLMRVEPETVSRWENDKARMSKQAEQYLRLLVRLGDPVDDYLHAFPDPEDDDDSSGPVSMSPEDGSWRPVA